MKPVEKIANQRIVEEIIHNMGIPSQYKDDLIQHTYMILLEYNQDILKQMIDKGEIKFFISRIITNQYYSKTSSFFKLYKKNNQNEPIEKLIDEEDKE